MGASRSRNSKGPAKGTKAEKATSKLETKPRFIWILGKNERYEGPSLWPFIVCYSIRALLKAALFISTIYVLSKFKF
jgi:hypothetical protein